MKAYRDFPGLLAELGARDSVFRCDFDDEQLEIKPRLSNGPSNGDKEFEEYETIWQPLLSGLVSEEQALDRMTDCMERYYSVPTPLIEPG
jgi:hypothetical protein